MYKQLLLLGTLICLIAFASCTSLKQNNCSSEYFSQKDIPQRQIFNERIWDKKGIVVIGRIKLPPKNKVASRVPIYKDGSFCTAIYPGRVLVFYAHTYNPLIVTKLPKLKTDVYDAGTVDFVKAVKNDLRKVIVRVVLNNLKTKKNPITCKLLIRNHKYLWDDHGYNCGASVNVQVASKTVSPDEQISFAQLSRIPYYLVITSPGYIKQEFKVPQKQSGIIDLGEILLKKAVKLKISYRARVRQNGREWIGGNKIETAIISCNGNSEFLFSTQRDGLGNSLKLRMTPKGDNVEASFFYYQDNSFYNLGMRSIESITNWKDIKNLLSKGVPEVLIKDSQLYFFRIDDINGTEIELLFQAKRI